MYGILQQQRMVEMKMRDIEREIEQARLVREAEAGREKGPSWMARLAAALRQLAAFRAGLIPQQRAWTGRV